MYSLLSSRLPLLITKILVDSRLFYGIPGRSTGHKELEEVTKLELELKVKFVRNPTFGIHTLHSLQLHFSPFQHRICFLKIGRLLDCFISRVRYIKADISKVCLEQPKFRIKIRHNLHRQFYLHQFFIFALY